MFFEFHRAIEKHLKSLSTSPSKSLKFLDAGCGQGRLLTKFCSSLFQQCVGIDADPGRLQQTREALNAAQTNMITSKVQLFAEGADTFKSKDRFDFILNSMVIQHVSNKTAHKIVHNLINQLTPSHGVLVVLTTYFPKPTSFYEGRCASFQKNMSFCLTALTAKEFEKLVAHPTVNYLLNPVSPLKLTVLFLLEGPAASREVVVPGGAQSSLPRD